MQRKQLLLTLTSVGALTLAACGGAADDPSTAPPTTTTPEVTESITETTDPTTPPTTSESGTPGPDEQAIREDHAAGDPVSLQSSCDIDASDTPAGTATIAYPEGWLIEADNCGFFDPEMDSIDSLEPTGVDVVWTVDNAAYTDAVGGDTIDEESRLTATVAGRQAVRIQGTHTGEGMYPAGTRVTTWIVDLDPGTDDDRGILVGTAHEGDDIDYPHAVDVLDEMAGTVILANNPDAQASVDAVLAKAEGGGAPFAVVLDDGCLRLTAGSYDGEIQDEVCDDVVAGDQTMKLWTLSSDSVTVAAGLVSVDVDQVLIAREGQAVQTGTIPVSVEGAWAMAVPVQGGVVLHAVDAQGQTLATAAPLG